MSSTRVSRRVQDAQTVRDILLQAVDSTVEGLLRTPVRRPKGSTLSDMLDKISAELRDAPALSAEAVSRAALLEAPDGPRETPSRRGPGGGD